MAQVVTLIGASGLIGSHLLSLLLSDNDVSRVIAPARRPLGIIHPKLEALITDFTDFKMLEQAISQSNTVLSAVGTTQSQVKGDKKAYEKVDYDIPVNAARAAGKYGCDNFIFVSSVGANASNDNNYYLKLKGLIEEAVIKEPINAVYIMQPSLLLGKRKQYRFTERVMQVLMPVIAIFFAGSLRKYKPIQAEVVARAMLNASKQGKKGIFINRFDEIKKLAGPR